MTRHATAALLVAATACGGDSVDADARPRPDGPPPADGGPGVFCLGARCDPTEVCCGVLFDDMPRPQFETFCLADDPALCPNGSYTCDGPEDCPDTGVCCVEGENVACSADGTCGLYRVCHTPLDCGGLQCCEAGFGVVKICQVDACAR